MLLVSLSSVIIARGLVAGLLLSWPELVAASGESQPQVVQATPTPNLELELYRRAVQEVVAAEVEYRKLLEAASVTLVEYQNAVKAAADANKAQPSGLEATLGKILELVSAAGLGVAAIFFGFFSVLVASMPGLPDKTKSDKQVKELYWKMAHANAAGIMLSIGASICAIISLGASSSCWAWCAIILGALAAGLVVAITAYFELKLWQRTWHV